jgi:hypothetical protein
MERVWQHTWQLLGVDPQVGLALRLALVVWRCWGCGAGVAVLAAVPLP